MQTIEEVARVSEIQAASKNIVLKIKAPRRVVVGDK
jgi:CheY-like chemotaxis protein